MHTNSRTTNLSEVVIKWMLIALILTRCVFLAIPGGYYIHPFPFAWHIPMTPPSYSWAAIELFAFALITWAWWYDTRKTTVAAFFLLSAFDWIDFMLTANNPWFPLLGYPITNNVFFAICLIPLTFIIEKTRGLTRHY